MKTRIAGFTLIVTSLLAACGTSDSGTGGGTTGGGTPPGPAVCVTNTNVDVNVTVTTKKGPQNMASPRSITNNFWSMNVDDQVRGDYYPTLNPNFVALLKALHPANLRWPAGYYGQQYTFSTTAAEGPKNMTPTLIDSFMALAQAANTQAYLAVNLQNGTAANAAQFVQYVNVTKKYGVKWWQLGNEPDVNYYVPASGFTPQNYASAFLQFSQAMKAVDSSIKLVGAEVMTGSDIAGLGGFGTCGQVTTNNCDWMTPILQGTSSAPMDAIAFHYYPMDSSQTDANSSAYPNSTHLLQENANDWAPAGLDFASEVIPAINKLKAQYAPNAQIWVDEFAEDSGKSSGNGLSDRAVGDLWAADALGRFAEYGADATFHFIFKGDNTHYYALVDTNDNPRPEYYTYWLYANQWGDTVVNSTTDQLTSVNPHAALSSADGSLHVMLVNKQSTPQNVRVTLEDFTPYVATQYTLQGASMDASSVTLNGQALTGSNVSNGVAPATAQACKDNIVTVPATSVVMLNFTAAK